MKYLDSPISLPGEDTLNRRNFAQYLADAIIRLDVSSNGFAIGLNGEWGVGKTSIISLIIYFINEHQVKKLLSEQGHLKAAQSTESLHIEFKKIEPLILEMLKNGKNPYAMRRGYMEEKFSKILNKAEDIDILYQYWMSSSAQQRNPNVLIFPFSPWLITNKSSYDRIWCLSI